MRKRYASTIGKGIVSALLLVVALFPIFWLLGVSLRPTAELKGHITLLPRSLTMAHFSSLFAQKGFGTAIKNSVETTISATLLSLAIGLSSAYVLSRKRFRFGLKRPVSFWVMLVRILPPVAFTIPLYTMFAHTIDTFRLFDKVNILTGGGPAGTTSTITQYIYTYGIKNLKFGFGSAGAVVMTLLVLALSSVTIRNTLRAS